MMPKFNSQTPNAPFLGLFKHHNNPTMLSSGQTNWPMRNNDGFTKDPYQNTQQEQESASEYKLRQKK